MQYVFRFLFIGLISLIFVACSAPPNTESTGEFLDSSTTTARVKASLVDQLGTTGIFIKVKTYKDQVQLSGFVNTPRVKSRAGAIASGVDGVRTVQNDIIVKTN